MTTAHDGSPDGDLAAKWKSPYGGRVPRRYYWPIAEQQPYKRGTLRSVHRELGVPLVPWQRHRGRTLRQRYCPAEKFLWRGGIIMVAISRVPKVYNPATGTWSAASVTCLEGARMISEGQCCWPVGKVLVAGGYYGTIMIHRYISHPRTLRTKTQVVRPLPLRPPVCPAGRSGRPIARRSPRAEGTAPYEFTIMSGTLPAGLSLSSTGLISGTPTASGTFPFTVMATDKNACPGGMAFSLSVTPHGRPVSDPW